MLKTENKKLKILIERSIHYRGLILHLCTILEKEIETYIVEYFQTPENKSMEFMELILDRLTFDAKISILDQIIRKKFGSDFGKKGSKFASSLRGIKETRNNFAHHLVYAGYPDNEVPKEFSLVSYRNSENIKTFSKEDYSIFYNKISKCRELIISWKNEL